MEEAKLANVFNFVYLGHSFQADGDASHGVEVRMAKAKARFKFGKLRSVWSSSWISLDLKLMLYKHAVVSALAHAHEAWKLTEGLMRRLNGWNSRCVAIITGRS